MMDNVRYYNRPVLFYVLAISITWVALAIAAPLSYMDYTAQVIAGIFILIGLVSPTVAAFTMMYANKNLRHDLFTRLFKLSAIKPLYIFLACCLMPLSILLAQGISLVFGYSAEQFAISRQHSFTFVLFSPWVMLLLAPFVEELAWHSYGTDCLRAKMNLFWACIVFSIFWIVWHLPLSFINGYYHNNIAGISAWHSLNFAVSLFPFVFLMNWLYYKSNRNILIAVAFHMMANVFNEIFCTHPDTKIIQTALLVMLSATIMYRDRTMFFHFKARS